MNVVKSSLKYPQVTLSLLAIVVVLGVNALLNMPRREDPLIKNYSAQIVAYFPGANPQQVEEQVAKKVESILFGYGEINKSKTLSTCKNGLLVVTVTVQSNTGDPQVFWSKLRQDLFQARSDLPRGVVGPFVNANFGDTLAMLIGVESDELSETELTRYVQQLEDDLRSIRSVSKLKRIGGLPEQISVNAHSAQLAQYGIKFGQVVQLLQEQNAINATGSLPAGSIDVPIYAKGFYKTQQQVAGQLIGSTTAGGVIRLGDVASVNREAAEPTTRYTINGHRAMLLSLEVLESSNVVQFGQEVEQHLAQFRKTVPSSLQVTTIISQPNVVKTSVGEFIREFFLAIVSVVIVTILLLPFRIAAVAAMAIPVTVAFTFALINMVGIELQQVSLAGLIVVLGMVVDDAIVIADNYVELLDEGLDRWTAAWRSASDLFVPVLTATMTIIAAFFPLSLMISDTTGEFIFSLSITVSLALAASFVVAMVLTPLLCYTFIRQGLRTASDAQTNRRKKKSLLDSMQLGYDRLIGWCMRHKAIPLGVGLVFIVGGVFLFTVVKQKFMPAAERNQFIMEVVLPTATRLERTEAALARMEQLIKSDKRVVSYITFAGAGAPRFYYNFDPPFPTTNVGQILVNTQTDEQTEEMVTELTQKVSTLIPEGRPRIRQMQQGAAFEAPVELRVAGPDLQPIKTIGNQIKELLRQTPGTQSVRTNFNEDFYGLDLQLTEVGNRLGFTTAGLAATTFASFSGYPVTTLYEGDTPLNVVLRLDSTDRQSVGGLGDTYVSSPVTGVSVPLRQVVTVKPDWQTGQIVRRNGIRSLSIYSDVARGFFASDILKQIQPKLAALSLPPGYQVTFGGERENSSQTFSELMLALGVSLLLIFIVLLLQFRTIKEALVIMTSIPLSLFGAILGLVITNNPFGFTAFIGLISLSGIVVRNAIILVDHTNLLLAEGMNVTTAAMESGKRRLRPIFLTASAAAIGVLPMILSGSPLWSPLASVLAVGVMFSTAMALLVIPVILTLVVKPHDPARVIDTLASVPQPIPTHD